jgi:predicted acetyltransferase
MKVEIRPCRDRDELAQYGRVMAYVFSENDQETVDSQMSSMSPDWTHAAFVDGRLVSTLGVFPFTVRLNGSPVAMGGVTQVGTLPEQRRRGLLRQTMEQALATMRDRGQAFAILWASMGAIYQRFGYGLATTQVGYRFDPRFVGFERPAEVGGSIETQRADDAFPVIKQLYIQYATPRNLFIHRASELWRLGTLRPHQKGHPVYAAIYRDDAGEPRGYMVYRTEDKESAEPGPSGLMEVRDFVALDLDAYRGLWEFMRRHDLIGTVRMWNTVPEDDPAPRLLLEPRMLNRHTSDGIWMRVVDVEQGLAKRPYGGRGEVTFAIGGDDMCDWNNGTYLLETDGPSAEVRRVGREPEIVMPPRTLASLVSGHDTATNLQRWGLLDARDERALRKADELFATNYRPHCPNGF